jgi:hypothetical protein
VSGGVYHGHPLKLTVTAVRWAPSIVNPVDANGKGILYKFDFRDYWGYSLIDTSAGIYALEWSV